MSSNYYDYETEHEDWDDEGWDCRSDEDYIDDVCTPMRCGDCWLGDGLCDAEISEMARQDEEFDELYVKEHIACPVCSVSLTQYELPTDQLWVWPGQWPNGANYFPMIALDIFAVYDAPKGEVHPSVKYGGVTYHHIWVGIGELRSEKLIRLTGKPENGD